MTTLATTIANVRRILKDTPGKLHLNGAIADTTEETVTLDSGEISRIQAQVTLEHDDGTGEQRRVLSIDDANNAFEAERGYNGSTAATHSDNTYMLINPRFSYDIVSQAITHALVHMWNEGLYVHGTRELTSSLTDNVYNLPDAAIDEVLAVYQQPSSFDDPVFLTNWQMDKTVRDTDLFASGYSIFIGENVGIAGTDLFYLTTKEQLAITTISTNQEPIVQNLAAALLLEWETPKRLGGPTNQGDRTVTPTNFLTGASYFREVARRAITVERSRLRRLNPPKRNWKYS